MYLVDIIHNLTLSLWTEHVHPKNAAQRQSARLIWKRPSIAQNPTPWQILCWRNTPREHCLSPCGEIVFSLSVFFRFTMIMNYFGNWKKILLKRSEFLTILITFYYTHEGQRRTNQSQFSPLTTGEPDGSWVGRLSGKQFYSLLLQGRILILPHKHRSHYTIQLDFRIWCSFSSNHILTCIS